MKDACSMSWDSNDEIISFASNEAACNLRTRDTGEASKLGGDDYHGSNKGVRIGHSTNDMAVGREESPFRADPSSREAGLNSTDLRCSAQMPVSLPPPCPTTFIGHRSTSKLRAWSSGPTQRWSGMLGADSSPFLCRNHLFSRCVRRNRWHYQVAYLPSQMDNIIPVLETPKIFHSKAIPLGFWQRG